MKIKNIFVYTFLFLLTALVLDLANPLFDRPSRDGGFFLYAGQQILDGKIPYKDFWDSKGPAIFYINALGLFLGNGSRWGVWFLEFIFIFSTFLILYKILSKQWGISPALFGLTMAGFGLRTVLGYGNYTEEYALLFNALGIMLFFSILESEKTFLKFFWIGALFGLSFTFRANNIGGLFAILIAIFIYFIYKRNFIEAIKSISTTLLGFIFPLLLWALYFTLHNAASEMIYASLIFNFAYSAAQERHLFFLFEGFGRFGMGAISWLAVLAWIVFAIRVLRNFKQKKVFLLEIFLIVWFPIEVLLSNLSSRNFSHYYISWFLVIAVLFAMLFDEVLLFLKAKTFFSKMFEQSDSFVIALLTFSVIIFSLPSFARYNETLTKFNDRTISHVYIDPTALYVKENTEPNHQVLTWYSDLGINFMAERTSPVKYVYYPLFYEGTLTEEIEESYIQDLITKQPEMIIDCSRQIDAIPSMHNVTRKEQFATPGLRGGMYIQPRYGEIFDFVKDNYYIETTIDKCIIFRINQ
jgi:hypothetical protein